MCNHQCYKSIIEKMKHTQHGRDTSVVITVEPCVSERVCLNITTMGNNFLLTTKEKKKFYEIISD